MNRLRLVLGIMVVSCLALGYLVSQFFYLNNQAAEYAKAVDGAPVKWLSLLVLLLAIGLMFLPSEEPS